MLRKIAKLSSALAVVAGFGMAAAPAMAQDAPRGKQAGDLVIGFGAIGVLPANGGQVNGIAGVPKASNAATPQLDATYFFTPNLAINVIAATSQHDVRVAGVANTGTNLRLGHVWALPPTVTLQYHPFPTARLSPYVGAGLNVTLFYGHGGTLSPGINRVRVDPSIGPALNIGVDYEVAPNWLVNFDVKKIFMRSDVSVNNGAVTARANIDPWVIGASVRYRF
jgi:outer membrane protein